MSKSTSKHENQEEKEPENDEINQRVEGGEGTGETKPLDKNEDQILADEAMRDPIKPTKPPTGPKPGEIEV